MPKISIATAMAFFGFVLLIGIAFIALFIADHGRAPDLPQSVISCEDGACTGQFDADVQAYEDRLDPPPGQGGLSIWADKDYCAIALDILRTTASDDRARWIPESLARRDVLKITPNDNGYTVTRGPAISTASAILTQNMHVGGTRSCHLSDYGSFFSIWLAFLLITGFVFVTVWRNRE